MASETRDSGGSEVMTAMLVIFVVLKIAGVVDWPWWAVLLPLWLPMAVGLFFIAVAGFVVSFIGLCVWISEKK